MKRIDFTAAAIADLLKNDTAMPVVLCVGTDRVTGDALGPLTGQILTARLGAPFFVYGTLLSPVTALSLDAALTFIRSRHSLSKLIAIDSSLASRGEIGSIRLSEGGLRPGAALGKRLPITGDISITAAVGVYGEENALDGVRLGFVYGLACKIAETLVRGVELANIGEQNERNLVSTL